MSDATLNILFKDNGDNVPPQASAPPASSSAKKPHDTVNGNASDTNPNGVDSPYERTGPEKTEPTPAPKREDAEKGMAEFFEVLKDSGQKVADVAGVGHVYSTIAEMLGGINAVVQAFRTKTTDTINGSSAPSREAAESVDTDADAARAASSPERGDNLQVPNGAGKSSPEIDPVSGKPIMEWGKMTQAQEPTPPPVQPVMAEAVPAGEAVAATAAPEAATGLAGFAAALGPAGIAVAGITAAVAAGAVIMKLAFDAIRSHVDSLQDYSAEVAVAAAGSELRQEMATMRRAESLGPDVASFEQTRGKIDEKIADLQTEALRILLNLYKIIEPLAPVITTGISLVTANLTLLNAAAEAARKTASLDLAGASAAIEKGQKDAAKIIVDGLKTDDDDDFEDPWMAQWFGAVQFGMPRHPGVPGGGQVTNKGRRKNSDPANRHPTDRGNVGGGGMGGGV